MNNIEIRFYEELNDFLPLSKRKSTLQYSSQETQTIKDIIESIGVPHTEIDLIIVNQQSVNFSYKPKPNDRIAVYPKFEAFDITPLIRLRPLPLREPRFVLDVHLGKLARYLRLLGFDVLYNNSASDEDLVLIVKQSDRILLTRDINLLKNKAILRGTWIRNIKLIPQLKEVIQRFDLLNIIKPFARCLECNGIIVPVEKDSVVKEIPPLVGKVFSEYHQCLSCQKIYWAGSHYDKMRRFIEQLLQSINSE